MTAFGGVTIHARPRSLFYAWLCLSNRNVESAAHCIELLRVDSAVDHAIAVWADATKGPSGFTHDKAFGHIPGGHLWRPAGKAEDAAGTASPLRSRSAV